MKVTELKYSSTNTYLIEGEKGCILFDTGWAGTFPAFCRLMGDLKIPVQKIRYVLISHFHPDHYGIAQEIAYYGPVVAVADVQRDAIHSSDLVFAKEGNRHFIPIKDEEIRVVDLAESRSFLAETGLNGEIIHSPGHSDDSISLWLDEGALFVGDLNPLYEIEMHRGTKIEDSWNRLLMLQPRTLYYGHAKTAVMDTGTSATAADPVFIEDVARMYLTHSNVGAQGILDRIEIKGR